MVSINSIKTVIFLSALSALFMMLGSLVGGRAGLQVAFIMSLVMNGIAYFFSDKIVLSMYKAQPLDPNKYAQIYTMIQGLAKEMNLPMPKLWLVPNPMANAFATGRSPSHASVALTSGILEILDPQELRGVLAHEMSHVRNNDILVTTIAATLASAIGYIANMLRFGAYIGVNTSSDSSTGRRSNPLFLLVAAMVMPIAATLLQLALSRSREYLADETGAEVSADPLALAAALGKLEQSVKRVHLNNSNPMDATTAPLFIVHPLFGGGWANLFATHPPIADRIARLKRMSERMPKRS
jgi:heat shock protein HtpX